MRRASQQRPSKARRAASVRVRPISLTQADLDWERIQICGGAHCPAQVVKYGGLEKKAVFNTCLEGAFSEISF